MEQLKFARTLCAILRCSNELCNRCFILVQFRIIYNSNSALFNHWCIQPVPFMLSLSSFRYTINHLNEYYTISNNYTFNCISHFYHSYHFTTSTITLTSYILRSNCTSTFTLKTHNIRCYMHFCAHSNFISNNYSNHFISFHPIILSILRYWIKPIKITRWSINFSIATRIITWIIKTSL